MNQNQRLFVLTNNPAFLGSMTQTHFGRTSSVFRLIDDQHFPMAMTPPQPTRSPVGEFLVGLGLGVVIVGGVLGIAEFVSEIFGPRRNDQPLTNSIRRYIRERDDEICFYCGDYDPRGHVDHRVSRANGGGNEVENLTWACVFCNCSKGAMNDAEYIALLEVIS